MTDYEHIADVIRYLDENQTAQPDLASLASRSGLSEFHFQRIFTRFAGVSPKRFLQCLTMKHARSLLLDGASVLDAAIDSGLSGPGRLHDLCVKLEAATPGEIKSRGAGWTLTTGFAESPFGLCLLAENERGICHLSFAESADTLTAEWLIGRQWPKASIRWNASEAKRLCDRVFSDEPSATVPLRAYVRGSEFQIRVWQALLRVPAGALVSYSALARAAGSPGAARAVGSAVGSNPLAWLIPCHRVIRETGAIGQYRWGNVRKRAILCREHVMQPAPEASL